MKKRSGKPKFRPIITRVKLYPEQAVLTCPCYDLDYGGHIHYNSPFSGCVAGQRAKYGWCDVAPGASQS